MIFKRKKTKRTDLEKKKDYTEPQLPEETVYAKLLKVIEPLERKQKIKHLIYVIFIMLGMIGGYMSYLPSKANQEALAASETQTFVKTYINNYFTYPSTSELDEYFTKYSLNPQWRNVFDNDVISAVPSNIEIYKVTPHEDDDRYTDYYLYFQENVTLKEGTGNENCLHDIKVTLFKDKTGYLVTSPVIMNGLEIQEVTKEMKEDIQYKPASGNEQLNEETKKEVTDSLSLFLKTYSTNYDQAVLLVDHKDMLNKISRNVLLELDSIISCTKDSKTYYVEAVVKETLGSHITNKKKIHFEIDIEKNKITEMEEY